MRCSLGQSRCHKGVHTWRVKAAISDCLTRTWRRLADWTVRRATRTRQPLDLVRQTRRVRGGGMGCDGMAGWDGMGSGYCRDTQGRQVGGRTARARVRKMIGKKRELRGGIYADVTRRGANRANPADPVGRAAISRERR